MSSLSFNTTSSGENTWIVTHGTKEYDNSWYSVEDRKSIVFSVKACSNAYVMLSDDVVGLAL